MLHKGIMFKNEENLKLFTEPVDSQIVLRYMTIGKYFDLVETNSLYFAHPTQFNDPFEGEVGDGNRSQRPEAYKDTPEILDVLPKMDEIAKGFTFVSCWTANENESNLMSATYAQPGPAVIVQSNWGQLKESIIDSVHVYGGYVNYVNFDTEYIPEDNIFKRHAYKRPRYRDEREVRLLVGRDLSEPMPNSGKRVQISIEKLVSQVWISGDVNGSTQAALQRYTETRNLAFPISSID